MDNKLEFTWKHIFSEFRFCPQWYCLTMVLFFQEENDRTFTVWNNSYSWSLCIFWCCLHCSKGKSCPTFLVRLLSTKIFRIKICQFHFYKFQTSQTFWKNKHWNSCCSLKFVLYHQCQLRFLQHHSVQESTVMLFCW